MDSSQVQLPQVPKKKNNLFLVELGLFEIGFVVILLAFIFGLLNFMGILNLGKVFPQLSFLPHLTKSQSLNKFIPPPTPTPTPSIHTDFAYDKTQAQQGMQDFLSTTLQKQYIPSFISTNPINVQFNLLSYLWTLSDGKQATVLYVYQAHKNTLSRTNLTIDLGIYSKPLSKDFTLSTLNHYLTLSKHESPVCTTTKILSLCEIFTKGASESIGYGLNQTLTDKKIYLFSCIIPKENKTYSTTTSCIIK